MITHKDLAKYVARFDGWLWTDNRILFLWYKNIASVKIYVRPRYCSVWWSYYHWCLSILFHSKLEYLEIANSAKIKIDIWNQTFKRFINVTWLTGTGHYIRHLPLRGCPFHWNISLMPHGWQNNRHLNNKQQLFLFLTFLSDYYNPVNADY